MSAFTTTHCIQFCNPVPIHPLTSQCDEEGQLVASLLFTYISRSTSFSFFQFVLTIIRRSRRSRARNRKGLGSFILWVISGGCQLDELGVGPDYK